MAVGVEAGEKWGASVRRTDGDGLEEEVALLRARVRTSIARGGPALEVATEAAQGLVKAVAAQYRLSPRSREDLAESIAAVLNSFGDLILPPDGL